MQPTKQITQGDFERAIAVGTAEASTLSEILERAATPSAGVCPRCLGLLRLLAHRGEKGAERRLRLSSRTFYPLFSGAPLAKMQGRNLLIHDLGEVDDRFPLMALLAGHQGINS